MSDLPRLDLLVEGLIHPGEVDRFVAAAAPTSPSEFPGLRLRVQAHLARVETRAESEASVDVETARAIAQVLSALLDQPSLFDDRARALLRGAAEYFVLDRDDSSDTDWLGFDDDARVLNAVLAALGRDDLRIELE